MPQHIDSRAVWDARTSLEVARSYPMPDVGDVAIDIDDETFGARRDSSAPFGGGLGYPDTVTDGGYRVRNSFELIDALAKAQPGQIVYVEPDVQIDFSSRVAGEAFVLEVPQGVTLAGNRGTPRDDGSHAPGPVLFCDAFKTQPLIRATGPDVRITGLRIFGPDADRREEWDHRCYGPEDLGNTYYYNFPVSQGVVTHFDRLTVDNCEFAGFSHAAVLLREGKDHHVHHNWMHHNQRDALGYHVSHNRDANSLIEHNVFDYARHAIAGSGNPGSGYEARDNVILPNANGHSFDMHGGADRKDGTNIAGGWMHVHHNTFMATYLHMSRPAISVRGNPEQEALVEHNWFHHCRPGPQTVRYHQRTRVARNLYGPPPSTCIVVVHPRWTRPPSAACGAPPSAVSLTYRNLTDIPANVNAPPIRARPDGEVDLQSPSGLLRFDPREVRTIDVEAPYLGRRNAGSVEIDFGQWPGGVLLLADSDRLVAPVEGRTLPRVTLDGDLASIDAALASAPRARVIERDNVVFEIRFALGDRAVLLIAHVCDRAICRTAEIWDGSCVEVFVRSADAGEPVRQVILAPEAASQPAVGWRAQPGDIVAEPSIKAESTIIDNGYSLRAAVPIELLFESDRLQQGESCSLEFQASVVDPAVGSRRHVTAFGTDEPFKRSDTFAHFTVM